MSFLGHIGRLFLRLAESYIVVLFLALFLGLAFPDFSVKLAPYATFFLGVIFFFSALKIDLKEVAKYFEDKRMIVVVNSMMLIVFPIVVFFLTQLIAPELAIAFLILAAMPSGMTTPLLAEIVGGKQSLALVFAVTTSLLAPITVPLVIGLLASEAVSVSFLDMATSLALVIFIPFVAANFVKRFFKSKIQATFFTFKPISIVLLGLLIMGIVAKQSDAILDGFSGGSALYYLAALFLLMIILHIAGYLMIFWRKKQERITTTVSLAYFNFTLAIYLAGEFFVDPEVVVPVIFSILPWTLLVFAFKFVVQRMKLV